jgi:hypothetical protein
VIHGEEAVIPLPVPARAPDLAAPQPGSALSSPAMR